MKIVIEKVKDYIKIKTEDINQGTQYNYFLPDNLYFLNYGEAIYIKTKDSSPIQKIYIYYPLIGDIEYKPEPKNKLVTVEDHLDYLARYIFSTSCCNERIDKNDKENNEEEEPEKENNNNKENTDNNSNNEVNKDNTSEDSVNNVNELQTIMEPRKSKKRSS